MPGPGLSNLGCEVGAQPPTEAEPQLGGDDQPVANQKPEAVANQKPETQPVNGFAPQPPEDVTTDSVQVEIKLKSASSNKRVLFVV